MKIRNATINNFRGLKELHLDFVNQRTNEARNLACLIGDNGSGKTTALQAIALVIGLATRRIRKASDLSWCGFLRERVSSLGPTRVEVEIEFHEAEVAEARKLFEMWYQSQSQEWRDSHRVVEPSTLKQVTLTWENDALTSPQGMAGINQFLGRYYIKTLLNERRDLREYFSRVGDVFWFDQYRNLGSRVGTGEVDENEKTSWQAGVEQLREFLIGMWAFHSMPDPKNGTDYLSLLEPRFNEVFTGIRFAGISPMLDRMDRKASDFYFDLTHKGSRYDITEMSSGEQAVFSLLYEFVRLGISHSVVLIDELELHLHPPQQQALLGLLSKIGPNCQFIITTHSPYLSNAIPEDRVHRMERGVRCL